ncbi:MAG: N-acetylglucosamine-6-phosphate deacetylase [Candidatus Aminicenantales bacterium]
MRVEIENGLIRNISEAHSEDAGGKDLYVAPGLIDNQVNGYRGVDFADERLSLEGIKSAAEAVWKDGVTTFLPTLVTAGHDDLIRNLKILARTSEDAFFKGSIPGFHLEGPYLSPEPGYYGCHPVQHLRKPSWREFMAHQEAAGGKIIEVTLAPELESAIEFIRSCREKGIVTAIGHTNATAEQINLAVENGARLSTHLGNGCANLIHRHRNPLWPQLANDRLTPSLIADGHHLTSDEIRVFYKIKGPDNLILTSDTTHLIGLPPGDYVYLGSKVILSAEGLVMNPERNCLAGASLPLLKGIENMMNYAGCGLGTAVNLACRNVARVLGMDDRGSLSVGKRADLIMFEKCENRLHIKKTYVKGVPVHLETSAKGSIIES